VFSCSKLLIFLLIGFTVKGQISSLQAYNLGVEYYNKQEFQKADTLFTASLSLDANKDTYFSRGLCRGKMSDKTGYCIDMAYASYLGEDKATKLFSKGCGRIDTNYVQVENKATSAIIYARKLKYSFGDSNYVRVTDKYYKNATDASYVKKQIDTAKGPEVFSQVEEMAEFPGGLNALMAFIKRHLIIPSKGSPNGKVFLKFTVNEDGSINAITILKGIPNCQQCNEEAARVVAIMPYWKPAKMKGVPVKCYFNLPIGFRVP
jgi:protein TonB